MVWARELSATAEKPSIPMSSTTSSRVREVCYKLYWWLQKFIAPHLRDSQYLYKEVLESYVPNGGRWLELGCGHQILPAWMRSSGQTEAALISRTKMTAGIDPVFEQVRNHRSIRMKVVASVEHCPFRSNSFDLLSCNMVMEHVTDPAAALSEASRVLKDDGILLFHTPNLRNYQSFLAALIPQFVKNQLVWLLEGRRDKDVFPARYQINTATKIGQIAAQCGFQVIEIQMVNSTAATAMLFPLAVFELFLIRLLEIRMLARYRTNIITILKKKRV